MVHMTATKRNEIRTQMAHWINGYTFSTFVTLTAPNNYRSRYSVPDNNQEFIDRFFAKAEQELDLSLAAIGLTILSYGGHLHSHLVAMNSAGRQLTPKERDTLERSWHYEADAQQITTQDSLLDYIVSEKHLERSRAHEITFYRTEILASSEVHKTNPMER